MQGYLKPPIINNSAGEPRRFGFELEFGNLTVRECAEAIRAQFGGEIEQINPFAVEIVNSALGRLKVERDAKLLTSSKHRQMFSKINLDFNLDAMLDEIEDGVDRLSSYLIPCEIVTEPLPFEAFPGLDEIVTVLNRINAKGTQGSFLYAFGLHINPAAPDLGGETILAYLQSFLLIADWIIEDAGIDFSRRFFTSYIDPFPGRYLDKILDEEYAPSLQVLIGDYLDDNPTRNRPLDMLPLFCEIDDRMVMARVNKLERDLIGSRPAFHYRLPDCRLGDQTWSIASSWNRWWYVEVLAADRGLRAELLKLWKANSLEFFMTRKNDWIGLVREFLDSRIKMPEDQ